MILQSFVSPLKQIARQAGRAIMEIYESSDFGVERKGDDSPLTRADKAANKIICDGLEELEHRYPIISEENKTVPYAARKDYDYFWLVDPLDGTKEFIKKNGEFTVNIALVHQGQPVLGMVYAPAVDEMYWGVKGGGAWLEADGHKQPLRAPVFDLSTPNLKLVCSRSHLNEATKAFVNKFAEPELVSKGSSLKFLILARGEAHVYPRIAPTMEWDTAAAQVVLEEAGGKVLRYDNNAPLHYNKADLLNPYFIAYGAVAGKI